MQACKLTLELIPDATPNVGCPPGNPHVISPLFPLPTPREDGLGWSPTHASVTQLKLLLAAGCIFRQPLQQRASRALLMRATISYTHWRQILRRRCGESSSGRMAFPNHWLALAPTHIDSILEGAMVGLALVSSCFPCAL